MALATAPASTTLDPLLKWAGGKRWQLPHILPLWQRSGAKRLVEPFAGAMALTMAAQPDVAIVNDINPHLANFYRWVRRGLIVSIEMRNDSALYYQHRDRFNRLIWEEGGAASAEAAQLFYFLNRTGYNGLCRFNSQGDYNVPFGRYQSIAYRTDFEAHRQLFQGWKFQAVDFQRIDLQPGDFVYADPPYVDSFDDYSAGGFSWHDQRRTAEWLAAHDGPVVLTNQATPRIEALYLGLGYDLTFLDAPRRISRTGDRTPSREILATRNL